MKRSLTLLFIAFAAACATNDTPQTASSTPVAVSAYRADDSLFPVEPIPSATLHDAQRNKDVEMAIEYPTRGTPPFPVIIFSHGFGGSKDSYVPLTEYWTSHGYVCIKPNHADAGALRAMLDERRAEMQKQREAMRRTGRRGDRGPQRQGPDLSETIWQSQSAADWRNRVRDVTFIIDSLDQLEQKYPELKGKLDHARIGVAGHSYGAFTALLAAGMRSYVENPPLQFGDSRIRAVIAMSPQGLGSERGLTQESWASLKLPVMYMTGSNDRAGQQHDASWRKDPFTYSPAGDKYFVSIEGAGHMTFAGGQIDDDPVLIGERPYDGTYQQRGSMGGNRPRYAAPAVNRGAFGVIKMDSLAFWDAYLKNDTKGRDYLSGQATVERK